MELKNLIGISICISNYINILLGQSKRWSYWPSFKLETVEEVEAGMHPDEVAQNFNVSRSNVIKWVQQKEKLIDDAKSEYKNHIKIRWATKYVNLYKALEKSLRNAELRSIVSVLSGYGLVQEQYIENNSVIILLQLLNITLLPILLKNIIFEWGRNNDQKMFQGKTYEPKC